MRVKLTYTTDVEDVLLEAAAILANQGPVLARCIEEFNKLGEILEKEGKFSIPHFHEGADRLRIGLAKLDLRLQELTEIVDGFEQYERTLRLNQSLEEVTSELEQQMKEAQIPETEDAQPVRSITGYSQSHGVQVVEKDESS